MPVAIDALVQQSLTNSPGASWIHNVSGVDRVAWLCLAWAANTTTSTILSALWGATTMTSLGRASIPTEDGGNWTGYAEILQLVNPPLTTGLTVTLSFDTNVYGRVASISYTGVHQTTPNSTPVTATGTSTTPSVTLSVNAGDLAADCVFHYGATSATTLTAAHTARMNGFGFTTGGLNYYFGATQETPTTGSVAMGWTNPVSKSWAQIGAVLLSSSTGWGQLLSTQRNRLVRAA